MRQISLKVLIGFLLISTVFDSNSVFGQNHFGILFDVSGAKDVSADDKLSALATVEGLLKGYYQINALGPTWSEPGIMFPLGDSSWIDRSSIVIAVPYGLKNRWQESVYGVVNDTQNGLNNFFEALRFYPNNNINDNQSAILLARAFLANQFKSLGINNYYIIDINCGPPNISHNPVHNDFENQLISEYEQNLTERTYGKLEKMNGGVNNYPHIKFQSINLGAFVGQRDSFQSKNIPKGNRQVLITNPSSSVSSYSNPLQLNSNSLVLSWDCIGCKNNEFYEVKAVPVSGAGNVVIKELENGETSATIFINQKGLYRVTVTARDTFEPHSIISRNIYVDIVSTSTSTINSQTSEKRRYVFIPILLIIAILCLLFFGYYFWKKQRNESQESIPEEEGTTGPW